MIHQESYLKNNILRFHLEPNTSVSANEKAFSIYGILVIPMLTGGFLMYYVFQLYGEYLIISFVTLLIVLANVFFYYRRTTYQSKTLKLVIQDDYMQLFDQNQLYFQKELHQLEVQPMLCGKSLTPALKISSNDFGSITVGLKNITMDFPSATKNKLSQPDYWILDKVQSQKLMEHINTEMVFTG